MQCCNHTKSEINPIVMKNVSLQFIQMAVAEFERTSEYMKVISPLKFHQASSEFQFLKVLSVVK